jgi:hypothetical protein
MMKNTMGTQLKKQGKRKWTKEEKQSHYKQWKVSGLSQTAYCKQKGLSIKTFGHWVQIKEKEQPNNFSLVGITNPVNIKKLEAFVEIKWSNGIECRFPEGIGWERIMEVIRGVHHVACCTE